MIETAKTELKKLQESDDPKMIADGLSIWQAYAPYVRDLYDDTARRRVELLDNARDEIAGTVGTGDITAQLAGFL